MEARRKRNAVRKYAGQTENGRIDFTESTENALLFNLAGKGYHGHVIAKLTGLTRGQVYTRCRQLGIRLRDYRNGKTREAFKDLNTQKKLLILPKSSKTVVTALREMHFRRQLIIRKNKK